ncbi:MAG TPA: hypothetical protein PLA97_13225 [Rubrivivax sp.]|nr:hypothetical protein [Rubrivivax sp.]
MSTRRTALTGIAASLLHVCGFAQAPEGRRPPRPERPDRPDRPGRPEGPGRYSIQQATSDRAQLHTIAFNGLAFLTGDFAADTFLPPGKVSDYFGFQYLRDIDAAGRGHNTSFLTGIAFNVLALLTPAQRAQLAGLARAQQADVRLFAELRLPLIRAFRQNLNAEFPAGSAGLDRRAVIRHSAVLYALDGQIAWDRARVMADVLGAFTEAQRASLARLKFGDSRTWPEVDEPPERRTLPHDIDVAVMTYASEMFAWAAGSPEADTYFCPERHGMYFGGFGFKTAPAMGKRDYAISTALTGDAGADFLALLTDTQREHIERLPALQRPLLAEIVELRRAIATELRRFLAAGQANRAKVLAWAQRYGELDGEMSYLHAMAFAAVAKTLAPAQRRSLSGLRESRPEDHRGPFLYSGPLDAATAARWSDTRALFGLSEAPSR